MEWDLKKPEEFIKAYLQLLDVAKKCRDDFRKLLDRTSDFRKKMIASEMKVYKWRGSGVPKKKQATYSKSALLIMNKGDDKYPEDESDMSEEEGSDQDGMIEEEDAAYELSVAATPLVCEVLRGKKFDNIPLTRVAVHAKQMLQNREDYARERAGQTNDHVSIWLELHNSHSLTE